METLSKDVIGLIFHHMAPLDWICTSVVCKPWWFVIRKWMSLRKIQLIKKLKDDINLFGIYLPDQKNSLCLRPLYYLQDFSTGCKGEVHDYVCAKHKYLSLYNRDICEVCLDKPSSIKCFGNRCDSLKCRDYIYVLRDGRAQKVLGYSCIFVECSKKTDKEKGLCFSHAVKMICENNDETKENESTNEGLESHKGLNHEPNELVKYPCLGMTRNNTRCKNKTGSRLSKCHQHIFSPVSLL